MRVEQKTHAWVKTSSGESGGLRLNGIIREDISKTFHHTRRHFIREDIISLLFSPHFL